MAVAEIVKSKSNKASKIKKSRVIRGRRNVTFLSKNPMLAKSKGFIYLVLLEHPTIKPFEGKEFYKIGITENFHKRKVGLKFVTDSWTQETTFLEASILEEKGKELLVDKRTNKFSAKELDGFTEVFELTTQELNQILSELNLNKNER